MTTPNLGLEALLERMKELQDEGDANVSEGNKLVAKGQQKQGDARKIKEAILVVMPEYEFDNSNPNYSRAKGEETMSTVSSSDAMNDAERGYGYWTTLVLSGVESLNGGTVSQIANWVRKNPVHAADKPVRLKVSVRNALRSLMNTDRVEKRSSPQGMVFLPKVANHMK